MGSKDENAYIFSHSCIQSKIGISVDFSLRGQHVAGARALLPRSAVDQHLMRPPSVRKGESLGEGPLLFVRAFSGNCFGNFGGQRILKQHQTDGFRPASEAANAGTAGNRKDLCPF